MKQKLILFFALAFFSNQSFAGIINILRMIENYVSSMYGIQIDMLKGQNSIVNGQKEMVRSQNDINGLMKQVNKSLIGNSGWGTFQFHDFQTFGEGSYDWSNVIQMAERGNGSGELGKSIFSVSNQFPAETSTFNSGVKNQNQQKYYALKAQTIVATRAASQLDYNKIQKQIDYQQMLQRNIEKTHDLKAAIDLSNRIQVEGNLINLELLREVALTNQQQAISEQASLNSALLNAKFLTAHKE